MARYPTNDPAFPARWAAPCVVCGANVAASTQAGFALRRDGKRGIRHYACQPSASQRWTGQATTWTAGATACKRACGARGARPAHVPARGRTRGHERD